jgi:hypothetical protein
VLDGVDGADVGLWRSLLHVPSVACLSAAAPADEAEEAGRETAARHALQLHKTRKGAAQEATHRPPEHHTVLCCTIDTP